MDAYMNSLIVPQKCSNKIFPHGLTQRYKVHIFHLFHSQKELEKAVASKIPEENKLSGSALPVLTEAGPADTCGWQQVGAIL